MCETGLPWIRCDYISAMGGEAHMQLSDDSPQETDNRQLIPHRETESFWTPLDILFFSFFLHYKEKKCICVFPCVWLFISARDAPFYCSHLRVDLSSCPRQGITIQLNSYSSAFLLLLLIYRSWAVAPNTASIYNSWIRVLLDKKHDTITTTKKLMNPQTEIVKDKLRASHRIGLVNTNWTPDGKI